MNNIPVRLDSPIFILRTQVEARLFLSQGNSPSKPHLFVSIERSAFRPSRASILEFSGITLVDPSITGMLPSLKQMHCGKPEENFESRPENPACAAAEGFLNREGRNVRLELTLKSGVTRDRVQVKAVLHIGNLVLETEGSICPEFFLAPPKAQNQAA